MHHFFAYISRMKLIDRWSLMRCTQAENVQEHSLQVAAIAHALALIAKKKFGADVNPERIALLAVYHDATEVITGDLPTPVKYFNGEIKNAYKAIEAQAAEKLVEMLPPEFQEDYQDILMPKDPEEEKYVKAADVICAYIKCLEEKAAGNYEFIRAEETIREKLEVMMERPEVRYFYDNCVGSFRLTLDELSRPREAGPGNTL